MTKTRISFFAKPIAMLALLVLALSIFSLPASAHSLSGGPAGHKVRTPQNPPCWGSTCYGKDPYALGCANNITEKKGYDISNGVNYGTIWNDYSITCNANWTQGQRTSNATGGIYIYIDTEVGTRFEEQCYPESNPCPQFGSSFYQGNSIAWTNMVDGTNVASACMDAKAGISDIVDCVEQ